MGMIGEGSEGSCFIETRSVRVQTHVGLGVVNMMTMIWEGSCFIEIRSVGLERHVMIGLGCMIEEVDSGEIVGEREIMSPHGVCWVQPESGRGRWWWWWCWRRRERDPGDGGPNGHGVRVKEW